MRQPYAKYSISWEADEDQLGSATEVINMLKRMGCSRIFWSSETVHREAIEKPEPIVEVDVTSDFTNKCQTCEREWVSVEAAEICEQCQDQAVKISGSVQSLAVP